MDYAITDESDAESLAANIRSGIGTADPADVGTRDYRPIAIALRAADGSLLGGLYGATMWKWLMVDGLWVAKQVRGRGLGRRGTRTIIFRKSLSRRYSRRRHLRPPNIRRFHRIL